jgi:hypothetical protein
MIRRILLCLALAAAAIAPVAAEVSINQRAAVSRAPSAPYLLAASAVAASVTGTTSETALATIRIPAGAMGTSGGIEVRTTWSTTNSSNAKQLRIRLGGTSGTQFLAASSTTFAVLAGTTRIKNRGSASSQVATYPSNAITGAGSNTSAVTTGTVDTSAAQDLVLSGQLATSSETITLEAYEVWVLP